MPGTGRFGTLGSETKRVKKDGKLICRKPERSCGAGRKHLTFNYGALIVFIMKKLTKASPLSNTGKARILEELREKIQVTEEQFARDEYFEGGEEFREMINEEVQRLIGEDVSEITPEIRDQLRQRLLSRICENDSTL